MSHATCHSHASHYLLYINSGHCLYNTTALDQLPLSSQIVHSTQQVSWSSSSSMYIGISSTVQGLCPCIPCSSGSSGGAHSAMHIRCAASGLIVFVYYLSYPYFSQSQLQSNLGLPDLSLGIDATPDLVQPSPAHSCTPAQLRSLRPSPSPPQN